MSVTFLTSITFTLAALAMALRELRVGRTPQGERAAAVAAAHSG